MRQRFLDPLYGPISVDENARLLVFSPEFQRLRYVRLCNINSLFIMGASEPKRFEHCLGVYHLANTWAGSRQLSLRQARILKEAALVHDLLTGPFGHSFQYVLEDNPFEQQFDHANLSGGVRSRFLQRAWAGASFAGRPFSVPSLLGEDAEEVFAVVRGEGLYGPLISGTLDFDNLDNVVRLAFHAGLCEEADRHTPKLLTPLLDVFKGGLAARAGAQALMERWFNLRRRLYEYLLLDRGEFSAKAMLTTAVEAAVDAKLIGVDSWRLTDDELLAELETRSVGEYQGIRQTIRRLRLGDLFECLGVWTTPDTEMYDPLSQAAAKRALASEIEEIACGRGGSRLRICLHLILDRGKTCRSLRFYDLDEREERTVGYDSNALLVGAFVANARSAGIGEQERQRHVEAARIVLGRAGLRLLAPPPPPLACSAGTQDGLFGV